MNDNFHKMAAQFRQPDPQTKDPILRALDNISWQLKRIADSLDKRKDIDE